MEGSIVTDGLFGPPSEPALSEEDIAYRVIHHRTRWPAGRSADNNKGDAMPLNNARPHGRNRFTVLMVVVLMGAAGSSAAAEGPGAGIQLPEVVGGYQVAPGDWPDCVAISYSGSVECTGVLIAPDVVLTAGHCLGGVSQVYISTWDLDQSPGEAINVVQEIAFPDWSSTYDIGLLILEIASTTPPRLIAHGCAQDFIVDDASATVAGWGATDTWGTVYPTRLMAAGINIEDADCSDIASGCIAAVSPDGELIAGGEGVDGCYGDSGGPLYLMTPSGNWLVGITSRGIATASVPCGDGGIYVRPDAVVDWIEQQAGITLPEPDCDAAIFADDFESGFTSAWSVVVP